MMASCGMGLSKKDEVVTGVEPERETAPEVLQAMHDQDEAERKLLEKPDWNPMKWDPEMNDARKHPVPDFEVDLQSLPQPASSSHGKPAFMRSPAAVRSFDSLSSTHAASSAYSSPYGNLFNS